MTAREKTLAVRAAIIRGTGVMVSEADAEVLRLAERRLARWAERECGDGSPWAIERDEATGKPFNVYHGEGRPRRYPIPDLEAGALRRVAELCARVGLHYYHQTDPRGCLLYVGAEPLTDQNYHRGVACCS